MSIRANLLPAAANQENESPRRERATLMYNDPKAERPSCVSAAVTPMIGQRGHISHEENYILNRPARNPLLTSQDS